VVLEKKVTVDRSKPDFITAPITEDRHLSTEYASLSKNLPLTINLLHEEEEEEEAAVEEVSSLSMQILSNQNRSVHLARGKFTRSCRR